MSTLKSSDLCSDIILDFIAGGDNAPGNPSGESDGNYDAVIGNAHATADLGKMTLAQIYALQSQLVAKGEPSSAVGRYQFISKTLRGLVAALRIASDSLFTPRVEDQLAIELMNEACHYQDWRAGKIPSETFAHYLSTQWASLPDPRNDGKSHYDGVGPNHAGTTLAAVYAMLTRARVALTGTAEFPVPPAPQPVVGSPIPHPAPYPARPYAMPAAEDSDAEAERLNQAELDKNA